MKNITCVVLIFFVISGSLQAIFKQELNGIGLEAKSYIGNQGEIILHAHKPITAGTLLAKKIYPIHITIHNSTDDILTISSKSIMIPIVDTTKVARSFHKDNQFLSSLFLESFLLGTTVNLFSWGPVIVFSFIAGFLPGSGVGLIYWLYVRGKNKIINECFNQVGLMNDIVIIMPHSSKTKLLFLPVDSGINKFGFRVFDKSSQEVVTFGIPVE